MADSVTLHILCNDSYLPALSIPVDACLRFSVHPLKWLRYVAFTIYGNQGFISTSAGGEEVQDYHAPLQNHDYFYIPIGEPCWLDPLAMDGRTSDESALSNLSESRAKFTSEIIARDRRCILTGWPAKYCTSAHIIPHAKGTEYLTRLYQHHNAQIDPSMNDINNVHNGIFLTSLLHIGLGFSDLALLRTPNLYMDINDLALPEAISNTNDLENRITIQYFNYDLTPPQNSTVTFSQKGFPLPLIFDISYGCIVLNKWGLPGFMRHLSRMTKGILYDNNDDNNVDSRDDGDGDAKCTESPETRQHRQEQEKKAKAERRDIKRGDRWNNEGPSVLSFWIHNAQKARDGALAERSRLNQEKIEHWLDDIEHKQSD